jgi:hypothetical protein
MAVEFDCPVCGGVLRAGDGPAGRLVRCGGCLTLLKVPDAPPLDPAEVPRTPPPDLLPVAQPVGSEQPEPPPLSFPHQHPGEPDASDDTTSRKGMTFWLSVTLLALVLGTCGCCGLAAVILPGPDWQTHDSRKGGFTVDLPDGTRPDMADRVVPKLNRDETVEGTHLWTRAEDYSVTYWDVAPTRDRAARGETDQQLMEKILQQAVPPGRKAGRSRPISVSGFPGYEFEYSSGSRGTVTARVVVADTRVYVLRAGGKFTDPDSENVRRFLGSFKITDEKLLKVADERKARQGD